MTVLSLPAGLLPSKSTWGLMSNTEVFVSPLNGAVQSAGRPGDRWKATLEFSIISDANGALMEGLLAQLAGMSNRINIAPFHRPGTGAGAAVNGASQVGGSLVVSGAGAGRVFSVGDFFTVNGEFKMITAAVTASRGGAATISFAPILRASPPNGSALLFTGPTALMLFNSQEYALTKIPGTTFDALTLPFIEAFT